MSLSAFILVFAAAFCHAAWNYQVKKINAGPELVWMFSGLAVLIYLPLAVHAAWDVETFGWLEAGLILGSVLLHLAYFILLQAGYRKSDLSLVYPTARSTGPVLSALFAVFLLGEAMNAQMAVGAAIIILGVLMLTGGLRATRGGALVSLGFGLGAGTFIGSYSAWDAYTVSVVLVPPLLLDYASSVGRFVLLAPVAYRRRETVSRIWTEHRHRVCIIAVFCPLAYILVLVAMTTTPLVYVAPIRELSVVITVLMGSVLLGEGDLPRRLSWAAVIFLGVVTLALAE